MRVLFVAPFDGVTGGILRWAEHLFNYYQTLDDSDIKMDKFSIGRKYAVNKGQPIKRIINAIKDYGRTIRDYKHCLRNNKYDIAHISTSASLSLLKDMLMIRIAHRCGTKTVIHFHFGRIPELQKQNNWEWKLMKKVISMSDSVIVMTESSHKTLTDCGYSNIHLVPNPLSPAVTDYIRKHPDKDRIPGTILFVGHVIKTKGVEELVDACGHIENVKLKIIGHTTDEMKNLLRQKAINCKGDSSWLELTGELQYEQVLDQMQRCDVFVLPTYTEGFPNVILESMACGCAIVTTKVGAIPEMLEEDDRGKYGILIDPKNTEALESAIKAMLGDENLKNQCRMNAQRRVIERYSMAVVWNSLTNIWYTSIWKDNDNVPPDELLNRCYDALNHLNNDLAASLLHDFDTMYGDKRLSSDIICARLRIGSELLFRLGEYETGIDMINKNISALGNNPQNIIKVLICKGKLEMMQSRHRISLSSLSEALGLAESIGDIGIIAKVYVEIAHMFASIHYGLAIYFMRKAEIYLGKAGDDKSRFLTKSERALVSFMAYQNNRSMNGITGLKNEATSIAEEIDLDNEIYNAIDRRNLRYIKSYILGNIKDLRAQIEEAEAVGTLSSICTAIESYIAACMEAGNNAAALSQWDKYEEYEVRWRGESVREHILNLKSLLLSEQKVDFLPWRIEKDTSQIDLLDVLDRISLNEELWRYNQGRYKWFYAGIEQEGLFEIIQMPDGKASLVPCNPSLNSFYRGQTAYFEECYPSLYRKGVTPAMRFVERVKYEEFKLLVEGYPLIDIFANGLCVKNQNGDRTPVSLNVDTLALAQHYGIKTELMDLTTDKFVAAFFASTVCDDKGVYSPIAEDDGRKGVFYLFRDTPLPGSEMKLRAVGLQPFSRPGEQAGFVINMSEGENFNDMVKHKILFRHDPEIARFIFNFTNRSAKLFPSNILEDKANAIKSSDKFSRMAFDAACEEFYPHTDKSVCLQYMTDCGKEIVEDPIVIFTEEEKRDCLKEWDDHGLKDTAEKIVYRLRL